jgi:hypothetical protein
MADIKAAVSVLAFQIVRILGLWTANVTDEIHIANAMRVSVVGEDGEVVAKAMLRLEQQRLVAGNAAIVRLEDVGVGRTRRRIL